MFARFSPWVGPPGTAVRARRSGHLLREARRWVSESEQHDNCNDQTKQAGNCRQPTQPVEQIPPFRNLSPQVARIINPDPSRVEVCDGLFPLVP